jgi:hypothetical protein
MLMFYMPNLDNCTKPSPGIRVVPTIDDCGYQKKEKGMNIGFSMALCYTPVICP